MKLLDGLLRDWNPVGQSELIQVELMAGHLYQHLRLLRFFSATRGGIASVDETLRVAGKDPHGWRDDMPILDTLEKLQRAEAHILKNVYRAQGELERLQRMRLGERVPSRVMVDVNS